MAELIYGLMQSLDGYVSGLPEEGMTEEGMTEALHKYFNDMTRGQSGAIYGREMYELMLFWDGDLSSTPPVYQEFAEVWRAMPKWVVSSTLTSVGPNAQLLKGDLGPAVAEIKARIEGIIEVAGPKLAAKLSALGLIDEYRIILTPAIVGGGKPFFASPDVPALKLSGIEELPDGVVMIRYRKA